jgi:hypothetical protein
MGGVGFIAEATPTTTKNTTARSPMATQRARDFCHHKDI